MIDIQTTENRQQMTDNRKQITVVTSHIILTKILTLY